MRTIGTDRGAVRLATMTWVIVVLAVLGVGGYDGFSVMSNNVSTQNDAQTAAFAASTSWHQTPNLNAAYQAAVTSLAGTDDKVLTRDFTVDPDGTIHLLVRHTAHTLILSRVSSLRHYTVATEHGNANSVE
ncbi:MAG TPA: hypothetical protein VHV79_12680 [Mycobacteriales bacterium]|nr:hypothetical protein [Mycobacteriales bacterium]